MQLRKLLCPVLLLLLFGVTAKADSVTLNVTSWSYNNGALTITAVDATGKTITLGGGGTGDQGPTQTPGNGIRQSNIISAVGLPFTSTTTSIGFGASNSALNGFYSLFSTSALPNISSGTVDITTGLSATVYAFAGGICVPCGSGGQTTPSIGALSISLAPGTGTFTVNNTSVSVLLTGKGGTVTIDTPPAPVPEPATLLLLGSGLAALGLKARRRRQ